MQQGEQIKEQYKLLNLTRVEAAENRELLKKLDWELLQLNTSFTTTLFRETIMLTYVKHYNNAAIDRKDFLVVRWVNSIPVWYTRYICIYRDTVN